ADNAEPILVARKIGEACRRARNVAGRRLVEPGSHRGDLGVEDDIAERLQSEIGILLALQTTDQSAQMHASGSYCTSGVALLSRVIPVITARPARPLMYWQIAVLRTFSSSQAAMLSRTASNGSCSPSMRRSRQTT